MITTEIMLHGVPLPAIFIAHALTVYIVPLEYIQYPYGIYGTPTVYTDLSRELMAVQSMF